eukprot:4057561-Pleurochrysis_carterae.AAC.2
MQMRMHGDQSRNLKSQSEPRDRGSLTSIARPRKFSVLYADCNDAIFNIADVTTYIAYESSKPSLPLYGMNVYGNGHFYTGRVKQLLIH